MTAKAGRATTAIVERRNPLRRRPHDPDPQLFCLAVGVRSETAPLPEPPGQRRFGLAIRDMADT